MKNFFWAGLTILSICLVFSPASGELLDVNDSFDEASVNQTLWTEDWLSFNEPGQASENCKKG